MTQSNKTFKIIQIVPQLPPSIDGLGDYALNLARQLRKEYGIETHFVAGDPIWQGDTAIEDFPIQKVETNSASSLLYLLSTLLSNNGHQSISDQVIPVLLHYVGYGYAKRGCPVWLVKALENWKSKTTNSRLITMFHEVYASGYPPWTSSFWLSSLQKKLAARLALLSDRCLTSKQLYAEILYQISRGQQQQIPAIPVFSNIAEPQQVPPLVKRQPQLVVFGRSSNRLEIYQNYSAVLSSICELLKIQKILDIGPPIDLRLSSIKTVPIVKMGSQPAAKISEILLNSQIGFINYSPNSLAKSGVFAAYCAHGLLPVNTEQSTSPIDGIEPGKHYWFLNDQTAVYKIGVELQAIADNAFAWYQTHNLSVHAKMFSTYLKR